MWRVVLHFGPLPVWTTRDERVTTVVGQAMVSRLLLIARSQRLPKAVRDWAQAKMNELERLHDWADAEVNNG